MSPVQLGLSVEEAAPALAAGGGRGGIEGRFLVAGDLLNGGGGNGGGGNGGGAAKSENSADGGANEP